MLAVTAQLGYPALFGLIFAESAGVPVPGETALLTAGVLAGGGRLALPVVVVVAIAAAVTGDSLGYWLGRRGGRAVMRRPGPLMAVRARALGVGERFFERHGAKTVFLGRFVPGVRVAAAVLAGAAAMPWPRFLTYNVSGAFVWAATIASLASLVGPGVAASFWIAGLGIGVVVALVAALRTRRTPSGRHVPRLG